MPKPKTKPAKRKPMTQEFADEILRRMAKGESLMQICRDEHIPDRSTVYDYRNANEEFADDYARACDDRADHMFDEINEIANTPIEGETQKIIPGKDGKPEVVEISRGDMIQHRKLQIDTKKWILARMSPKKFGEKTINEHSGPDGEAIPIRISNDDMKL